MYKIDPANYKLKRNLTEKKEIKANCVYYYVHTMNGFWLNNLCWTIDVSSTKHAI